MKFFTNKKIWSKIIIVLIFVMLFEFIISKPTLADDTLEWGGKLIQPILSLIISLGDGALNILHRAILEQDQTLLHVDFSMKWYDYLAIVAAAIGAIVGVILIASGIGAGIGIFISSWSATTLITGTTVLIAVGSGVWAGYEVSQKVMPEKYKLPLYSYTPEEIFKGKILLFNVNFFGESEEIQMLTKNGNTYKLNDYTDIELEEIKNNDGGVKYYFYEDKNGDELDFDADGQGDGVYGYVTSRQDSAVMLRETISTWYNAIRNICLVLMLSVLVYVGIRILLSSVASDRAKYLTMLKDWFIGLCLLFLMHYIMAFSVTLVEKLTDIVSASIEEDSYMLIIEDKNDRLKDMAIEAGISDSDGDGEPDCYKDGKLYWKTNLMGWVRGQTQLKINEDSGEAWGYGMIFIVLVIFTVSFTFTYLQRLLYMAFLTLIAPLVALTYCIDKMNDGTAQGFNKWLKEYIFNLLIQPMHLLLYFILITSAIELAEKNVIYSVVAIGFMIPAEKLLRSLFGFEKAQTPGAPSLGATALTMSAVKNLSALGKGHGEKGIRGGNKSSNSEEESDTRTPRMDGNVDANAMFDDNSTGTEEKMRSALEGAVVVQAPEGWTQFLTDAPLPSGDTDIETSENPQFNTDSETSNNPRYDAYNDTYGMNNGGARASDREEVEDYLNNRSARNNPSPSSSSSRVTTNTYQKPKKKLKRRAGRAIKAGGKYLWNSGKNMGKNMLRQAPKSAIRFAGKAAGATALGAIGLATGIATGDPSKAFENTLTAGGVGYSLGGNLGDRVSTLGEKVTREYGATKNNMKGYEDLEHDDYMTQKEKEFRKTLKANFDKEKVKDMYENGTIHNYIENGVDDVQDIITAEKMREKDSTISQDKAILIAQYADRVGNEYKGSKAKAWRDTFSDEYQHTAGRNKTESDKAARETMKYIEQFNDIKKTNYK